MVQKDFSVRKIIWSKCYCLQIFLIKQNSGRDYGLLKSDANIIKQRKMNIYQINSMDSNQKACRLKIICIFPNFWEMQYITKYLKTCFIKWIRFNEFSLGYDVSLVEASASLGWWVTILGTVADHPLHFIWS